MIDEFCEDHTNQLLNLYSRNCIKLICLYCTMNGHRYHAFNFADEIADEVITLITPKKEEYCMSHIKQTLDLYCKTCSTLICRDCTLQDHPHGH